MVFKSTLIFASVLSLINAHCLYDNKPTLKACVRRCRASPTAGCISGCVAGAPYFVRPSCAACLGNGVVCAYRSCRTQCGAGIDAPGCTSCITRSCGTCGGYDKAGNGTEMAELAAFAVDFDPQADALEESSPAVPADKAEEKPAEEETKVAVASPKSGGCWEDQASLKYCGTKCFGDSNKARCATRCLRDERGMSRGCAQCFGDKVACTIRTCLSQCMSNGNSPTCKRCVRTNCGRCNYDKSGAEAEEEEFLKAVIATALPAEQPALYP